MTEPISLEQLEQDFDEQDVWVLRDTRAQTYVIVPDDRFPGKQPMRFFLQKKDAEALLTAMREESAALRGRRIGVLKVKLLATARRAAADSFVVHPPDDVFELIRARAERR